MTKERPGTAPRPLVIGLTGGIASGKSAVARRFRELGVPVIDTDEIARAVVARGTPGLERVREAFGEAVVDESGDLDRERLRRLVFEDKASRKRLEAILHPLILQELAAESAAAGGPYQIHVIPLLAESRLANRVHRVLVVDCNAATQVARLMARDGETEGGAQRILAAQADRQGRLAIADDVITNEGRERDLARMVRQLDGFYRELAASGNYLAPGLRLP